MEEEEFKERLDGEWKINTQYPIRNEEEVMFIDTRSRR
jgi:hypothetical protein